MILSLLLFCSAAGAEDNFPTGSKVTTPSGITKVYDGPVTCINEEEKEILVRNDDLWQVDKDTIVELRDKIQNLERKGALDDQELEIQKSRIDLEKQRSDFYKEQIAFKDQIHKDTVTALKEQIEVSKPSAVDKVIQKGGWVGLLISIGIIIGLAL